MPNEKPLELCIPKVSSTISQKKIFDTFCKLNIGYIERITENPLYYHPEFKRVIIRVKWDNTNPLAKKIQDVLLENPTEHMNVVYDMPWYWQIYANNQKK